MKIQYFHGTKQKTASGQEFTIAMNVPDKNTFRTDIWKLLGNDIKSVSYEIGISVVSPKDKYNKKIGRELSHSRLTPVEFTLYSLIQDPEKIFVVLRNEMMYIGLEVRNDRSKLHLLEVSLS